MWVNYNENSAVLALMLSEKGIGAILPPIGGAVTSTVNVPEGLTKLIGAEGVRQLLSKVLFLTAVKYMPDRLH